MSGRSAKKQRRETKKLVGEWSEEIFNEMMIWMFELPLKRRAMIAFSLVTGWRKKALKLRPRLVTGK